MATDQFIDNLNATAKMVYDDAYRRATIEIEEKTTTKMARQHGIDKLETCEMLARLLTMMDKESADAKPLAAIVRNALGKVPLMNAQGAIHTAMDSLGTSGFVPNYQRALESIIEAKQLLTEYDN